MGIEVGAPVGEFLGAAVETSRESPLGRAVIGDLDKREQPMSPGQDVGAALGPAAYIAHMRKDSGLAEAIKRLPMDVDLGRVDPKLIGAAVREQQEADAMLAAAKLPSSPDVDKAEMAGAIREQNEANVARAAVVKASAAKPPKMN